MKKKEI